MNISKKKEATESLSSSSRGLRYYEASKEQYEETQSSTSGPTKKEVYLLQLGKDGGVLYRGKPLAPDGDQLYMLVLKAILIRHNPLTGLATYHDIEEQLRLYGVPRITGNRLEKRIRNALPSIFRYSKLRKTTPTGMPILSTKRGVGILLNNPVIEAS